MQDCVFCKIINRDLPSNIIYEDDAVIAFKDLQPAAPVHVLIVPKIHIESVRDINEENAGIIGRIHLAANKIAEKTGIYDRGFRLINNCGSDAGQTVFHLHYHLLGGQNLGAKIL
jgi:histidine triad (HIT) family protein